MFKYLLLLFTQGIYNIYKWPITSLLTAYKKSDVKIGYIIRSNYTVFVFLCLISRPAVALTKFLFIHGMYKTVHVCKCVCP